MLKRFIVASFVCTCFFLPMLNAGQVASYMRETYEQILLQRYIWFIKDKTVGLYAALNEVIEQEHNFVLEQLLERYSAEIEIDKPDQDGRTLLFRAVSSGNLGAVQILLEYAANPNLLDSKKHSPLQHASLKRTHEIITELLAYGANPDLPSDERSLNSCRISLEGYISYCRFKGNEDLAKEIEDRVEIFDSKRDQEE